MTTPLTIANRQVLTAEIATLDFQISTLTKLFTAANFTTGSLMLIGKTDRGKHFNELITWRGQVPIPKQHLKDFLQHYCQHLIYQRHNCALLLEKGETDFQDATRVAPCSHCCRPTLQRNYFIINEGSGIIIPTPLITWICNECESIIKEGQP